MKRKFQFLDKELHELFPEHEKPGGNRFVDVFVKTFLKDASEKWIPLHIEVQGGNTKDVAARMFKYWYRAFDKYQVDVSTLALFIGGKRQKGSDHFHWGFLGTEMSYRYKAYHILDDSEEDLLAMNNPFALIALAAQKILRNSQSPAKD